MADLAARFDVSNSSWTTLPERRGQARAAALNIYIIIILCSAVGSRASVKCNTSSHYIIRVPNACGRTSQHAVFFSGDSVQLKYVP